MVGSQALVKPCMFASLFELTLELPTSLLSLGHPVNLPKVLQCEHPCQVHIHTILKLDYFLYFILQYSKGIKNTTTWN